MKTNQTRNYGWAVLAFSAIILSSWKNGGSALPVKPTLVMNLADTSPSHKKDRKEYRITDLDQAVKELDKAMADMDKNMKPDLGKMDREIKMAMEEVKKIDFDKISREVATELKKVNQDEVRMEIKKALRDAEASINEINRKEIREEMEKAKAALSKENISAHIDMEKIKEKIDNGLAGARAGIEKAKKEIGLLKEFTGSLEKDGLINRKKGYKVEIKDGEMYINGTKQSKEVNEKYRKYFKDGNYSIHSDGEDISHI